MFGPGELYQVDAELGVCVPPEEHAMTGYTVHTGSTLKFSQGWDRIFGNAKTSRLSPEKKASETAERVRASNRSGSARKTSAKTRMPKRK